MTLEDLHIHPQGSQLEFQNKALGDRIWEYVFLGLLSRKSESVGLSQKPVVYKYIQVTLMAGSPNFNFFRIL